MYASVDTEGELLVTLAALCDALVREARAAYHSTPSLPSLPSVATYVAADPVRGLLDALAARRADCVTLACAEAGRLQAAAIGARVVLSDGPRGVHARVIVRDRTIYDPAAVAAYGARRVT